MLNESCRTCNEVKLDIVCGGIGIPNQKKKKKRSKEIKRNKRNKRNKKKQKENKIK